MLALCACNGGAQAPATTAATAPRVAIAKFARLSGSVKVKPVGSVEWSDANLQTSLSRNDLVRTAAGASADLEFADKSVVSVRPDSLITIEGPVVDPSSQSERMAWRISSGEVNVQTQQGTSEVSTPGATNRVAGESNAAIRVAKAGDSDIRVFRGSSDVETIKGRKIRLQTQEGLRVDATGGAGDKVTLPKKPSLVAPGDAAQLAYENPAAAATLLSWRRQDDAAAYHVVVDSSAYFNEPLFDRQDLKQQEARARALGAGKFFWRVAAVGAQGLEGGYSDFASFSIVKASTADAAAPPALAIETLERRGNILLLRGRTEPGSRVTVNGDAIEIQPDGTFSEHLPADQDQPPAIVVRAVSKAGGITEQRRAVPGAN